MKNAVLALSALVGTALSTPLVTGLDFAQINDVVATAVVTGAPVGATATSSYVDASAVNAASSAATVAISAAYKVKRTFPRPSTSTTSCTTSTSTSSTSTSTSTSTSSSSASSTSTSAIIDISLPTTTALFCTSLATGTGPIPTPDTAAAFLAYAPFHASASAQAAAVPTNYDLSFTDQSGASQLSTYLTYKTLDTYSASACAAFCDATSLCTGFNIYFERDPSMDGNTDVCLLADLASTTNIKCALFGSSVSAESATNTGQYRNAFQVVITGSNGYNKKAAVVTPPSCNSGSKNNGWKSGTKCNGGGVMIKAGALIGQRFFAGPYNPAQCAAYAEAQVAKNKAAAGWWTLFRYQPCNSFNAVAVVKNKKTVGTYCSLFNVDVSASTCSYNGGRSGSDSFEVSFSNNYACKNYDNGNLLW